MWEVPRTRPRRVKYDDAAAFLALRFTKYSDFFFLSSSSSPSSSSSSVSFFFFHRCQRAPPGSAYAYGEHATERNRREEIHLAFVSFSDLYEASLMYRSPFRAV